jgi:phage tail-like protein
MSRGTAPHVAVRHRLGDALPAMFLDDAFIQRFCDGLDEVLTPVPSALDNFSAFLDPQLTPPDFLEWLAGWVGIEIDHTWPIERRRKMVARATELYRRRGTVNGLADLVELFIGVRPEIVEGGGVAWSQTPDGALPGETDAPLVVRLGMEQPSPAMQSKLDTLVAANKPAHVAHRLEFVAAKPRTLPPPTKEQP